MKRYKKPLVVKIEVGPPARGHYNFQGGKTTFDNRPKRMRTRAAIQRGWRKDYE